MSSITRRLYLLCCVLACLFVQAPLTAAEPQPRIVGGQDIDISTVPSTVALLNRSMVELDGDLSRAVFCGGTVIGTRWILSAAHCLVDLPSTNNVLVLMGTTDLLQPVNQAVGVTRVIIHEDYVNTATGKDIALLELAADALVQPVAVDNRVTALNDIAYIAGWGALNSALDNDQQTFPTTLQGATVRMVPGETCGQLFSDYRRYTNASVLCAGRVEGGVDSCQGDSGGPMYRLTNERITAVAGITSWGLGCAEATHPGVYTNVSAYIDWIREKTGIYPGPLQPARQPVDDQPGSTVASTDDDGFLGSTGVWFSALLLLLLAARNRRGYSNP